MTGHLWVLRCLLSHWRRHPLQLGALMIGLMMATALWSGVQAINAEARASYAQAAAMMGAGNQARLEPAAGGTLPLSAYTSLRRAGWPVSPVIEGRIRIGDRGYEILGVDPFSMPRGPVAAALSGETDIADFILAPHRTLAAPGTMAALGATAGTGRGAGIDTSAGKLPSLVAAEGIAPGTLVVDIAVAEAVLDMQGRITGLLITETAPRPDGDPSDAAGVALTLLPAARESDLARLTESFHLNLTAFGFLAFVVGIFIVHAAIGLANQQRLRLYRTLRATGVSARALAGVVLAELVSLALIAGVAGTLLGGMLARLLLPDVALSLGAIYGAPVSDELSLSPKWWAASMAMSLAGAIAAAGRGLWRIFRMPILASARPEAWRTADAAGRRLEAAAGLACLSVALGAWLFGDSLEAGFAVLAGLLLGAALLLPVLLAAAAAIGVAAARAPLSVWLWADMRQQLSGLSLALMALLLALAANVGVGTMVESFRTTFTGWLDQRLFADLYIDAEAGAPSDRLADWLAARPEIAAVLTTRRIDQRLGGWPSAIVGRPDAPAYRANWPLLSGTPRPWDRLADGTGAMVSEQLARKLRLGLGDVLRLSTPTGPWDPEIVGIYADYGNPKGEVGVGLAALETRWPAAPRDGFGLMLADGTDNAAVASLLADMRGQPALGVEGAIDQAALKRFSHTIFERTFSITAALNVLTLIVAGLALFTSLAMLAEQRLPGLAPLWAMGTTRARLAGLEIARTVALAALTSAAALPLGLALAWVLVSVVNVQAFGWRLPLSLFPTQWSALIALALALSAAAAAVPALRLARIAPARLAKIFAEER